MNIKHEAQAKSLRQYLTGLLGSQSFFISSSADDKNLIVAILQADLANINAIPNNWQGLNIQIDLID